MKIAVIGASNNREKFGNKCVRAYLMKGHEVFPVNPKEEKIEGLKYKTDFFIPDIRELIIRQILHIFPVEYVGAGRRTVQSSQNMHERRFSGTGRSHDRDKFPIFDLKIDSK